MKMTINSKYKLLIVIAVIGLITLFITGIPNNVFLKLTSSEEYNNIHTEYENMYQNLNMKSMYEENLIDLTKKINELNIDNEILQDQIISVLSNVSKKNNIELGNIKFSEGIPVFPDTYKTEEAVQSQENSAISMKVTVDFDSDFDDMISFIDDIKNSDTEISLVDISILLLDSQKVHVMLNLMFYALPLNGS